LIVTQSDIRAFKTCRRQWYYGTYLGLHEKDSPVIGPLTLGSRVHRALEGFYGDGKDLVGFYNKIAKNEYGNLEASGVIFDRSAWENETDLGRIMLEGYLEWLEETGADEDYEVIGAEKRLSTILDVDGVAVELRGKADLRVRNLRTGARLIMDHKTTAHFSNLTVTAQYDEQLLTYLLLERLVEKDAPGDFVQGAVFNMLRKVRRGASSKPPFYERLEVHHNDHTLRSQFTRIMGVLSDYVRVVQQLDAGQDHKFAAYPTPGTQCRYCPFRTPCLLTDDGSRADDMLASLYQQGDPHARYYEEPAIFLDVVAAN
jgi:RecB family exonuclease